MTDWEYNDASIKDEDKLYRRIPRGNPDFLTVDVLSGQRKPSPAAFQRNAGEGMSTHLDSVLVARQRDPETLYEVERYSSIGFLVGVPRQADAGVLRTEDPDEDDEDRQHSHAEVRPPRPEKDRKHWSVVRSTIADACWWVQGPN